MVGRPSACRKSLLQPLLMISSVRCPGQAFVRIRGPSPHYRWLQTARSTSCGATIRTDTPWCSQRNPLTVGLTWSTPVTGGDVTWRSAFFAAVTADPAGKVNVVFLAMDDVASGTTPGPGVVFYDAYFTQSTNGGASFSSPLLISASTSDPDGSSTNALGAQFLGDYITAVADSGHVYAVWTDSRNATPCTDVDKFRARTGPKPDVITKCPNTFGNTDIFLGTVS